MKPIVAIVGRVPFLQCTISAMKIRYLAYLETPLVSIFFSSFYDFELTTVYCTTC